MGCSETIRLNKAGVLLFGDTLAGGSHFVARFPAVALTHVALSRRSVVSARGGARRCTLGNRASMKPRN